MQTCCCDLAGTEACKHCSANGAQEKVLIWTNNDLTDYKSSKDTWEISSFMLKENSNES